MSSLSKYNPEIRSLDIQKDTGLILVGTRGSEVYVGNGTKWVYFTYLSK